MNKSIIKPRSLRSSHTPCPLSRGEACRGRKRDLGISLFLTLLCAVLLLSSCSGNKQNKEEIARLVQEWQGKEVVFPQDIVYTRMLTDTVDYQLPAADYTIAMYVDSVGCISCKLQLKQWKKFMAYADSVTNGNVAYRFFFYSKDDKELKYILRLDKFDHPVNIDREDAFNKLNQFPPRDAFHTFLLDKDNKVIVVGNPVLNPAVKDLYLREMTGKESPSANLIRTTAEADTREIDLGTFPRSETRRAVFTLTNTGDSPLVVVDAATTCGCADVSFDKEPVQPGGTVKVYVDMTPKDAGFFDETITVRCNTQQQIKLKIKGQAE